jgi:hypothetical protein
MRSESTPHDNGVAEVLTVVAVSLLTPAKSGVGKRIKVKVVLTAGTFLCLLLVHVHYSFVVRS